MSLGDESGLGPDPATYSALGQPVIVPAGQLSPDEHLQDDPLGDDDPDRDHATPSADEPIDVEDLL